MDRLDAMPVELLMIYSQAMTRLVLFGDYTEINNI